MNAGAYTFVYYPAHGATPSDWAKPNDGDGPDPSTARMTYNMFVMYRLLGVVMATPGAPAHAQIEQPLLAEAEVTGLSPAVLRERGNRLVQNKDWAAASVAYSLSLVLSLKRLGSAAEKMEAAKAATNRSFVHLQMAKEMVKHPDAVRRLEENAAVMQLVKEAKERGTGCMGEGPTTCPDLMQVLRGATLAQAVEEGRLEPWRMYAILAFVDADRADMLAPDWAKPLARQAEAARFLATQCAREGNEHGLGTMGSFATGFFEGAADREHDPTSRKQYVQLFRHMTDVYAKNVGPAVEEMFGMRATLACLEEDFGITTRQLQRAGFRMPPPRVGEEDRLTLFRESLHMAILHSPSLLAKYMRDPVRQANCTPKGAAGEWWSMACTSAAISPEGLHRYLITVVDSTKLSMLQDATVTRNHPWHNKLLFSVTIQSAEPPSFTGCIEALVNAILLPAPGSGPPRRPERLCIAWSTRQYYPALKLFGQGLGIKVNVGAQGVSLPAEVDRHTLLASLAANSPAGDDQPPGMAKGAGGKKKKKKKKK